jgi:hypothetical protein
MSPSLRYLHFLAISSHSSGPPQFEGAGPPMSLMLIFVGIGEANEKLLRDASEDEISASEA